MRSPRCVRPLIQRPGVLVPPQRPAVPPPGRRHSAAAGLVTVQSPPRPAAHDNRRGRTRLIPLPRRTILRLPCSPTAGRVRSPCRGRTLVPRPTAHDRGRPSLFRRGRPFSAAGRARSPAARDNRTNRAANSPLVVKCHDRS